MLSRKRIVHGGGFGGSTWLCECDCGNEAEVSEACC